MRTRLLSAILLSGIGCRPPDCVTPCGIPVFEAVSGQCAGMPEAENRGLRALAAVPEFAGRDLCKDVGKVSSLTILSADDPSSSRRAGQTVCGIYDFTMTTFIEIHGAWVDGDDFRRSALTHEFAHAILIAKNGCDYSEETHPRWEDRGIMAAIENSRSMP